MNEVPNKNMDEDFENDADCRLDSAFAKLMKETFMRMEAYLMSDPAECSDCHNIYMSRIIVRWTKPKKFFVRKKEK